MTKSYGNELKLFIGKNFVAQFFVHLVGGYFYENYIYLDSGEILENFGYLYGSINV